MFILSVGVRAHTKFLGLLSVSCPVFQNFDNKKINYKMACTFMIPLDQMTIRYKLSCEYNSVILYV